MTYRLLDLFSGIGGFSLGLERTGGFKTVAFCEIDPFCRKVLNKHWPDVPIYEDVRTLTAERLATDGIAVDVICGGFPCQDISLAGKGAGIEGERSGLWSEYARIIGELRPRYVIVENVAALLGRGLDKVLGDLAALGFDAEWHCIPASAVGAPHRRDRLWLVANSVSLSRRPDAPGHGLSPQPAQLQSKNRQARSSDAPTLRGDVADAQCERQLQSQRGEQDERRWIGDGSEDVSNAQTLSARLGAFVSRARGLRGDSWWSTEPDVGRVANGVPSRVDRLRSLGNAVVPQIPEIIGRAILQAEAA